ncbi:hypothetical protein SKAU_G00192830 [Synaphobranchus kaupii]|uniref:Integrase catalytic domain-containing protein n=1 Tax=Synaphobranchus kaupii TaxID=118154 RepID=A0A9Q1FDZ9_SYNKA|nr:hypothetical protein SKAU_G00192830 [Synaphobranchus kaupii]
MGQHARAIVYWPGMSEDIQATRHGCADCNRNAPSQAATPPLPSSPPSTPFEAVFADFFDYGGRHYLGVGDRLSGWVEVLCSTAGSDMGGSAGLVRHLRAFFGTFGVPEELSSDGGPEFTAGLTQDFLRLWGVRHRLSSVSFPQSNGRAEVAVKSAKRLLMSNTGPTGSLNHDRFLRAIIQLRNTPDPDCNLSPAQIVFGRPLRGSLSFVNRLEKFSNPHIRPLWRQAWAAKEDALRTRMSRTTESLRAHSRPLRPLALGERVFLQNQQGPSPGKWDSCQLRGRHPPATLERQPLPVHPGPVMHKGIAQRSADGPRDAALGPSLPPTDEAASDLGPRSGPTPAGATPDGSLPASRSPLLLPQPARSGRTRMPPKRYEPETGLWMRD